MIDIDLIFSISALAGNYRDGRENYKKRDISHRTVMSNQFNCKLIRLSCQSILQQSGSSNPCKQSSPQLYITCFAWAIYRFAFRVFLLLGQLSLMVIEDRPAIYPQLGQKRWIVTFSEAVVKRDVFISFPIILENRK